MPLSSTWNIRIFLSFLLSFPLSVTLELLLELQYSAKKKKSGVKLPINNLIIQNSFPEKKKYLDF